jgi:hypothetical protein
MRKIFYQLAVIASLAPVQVFAQVEQGSVRFKIVEVRVPNGSAVREWSAIFESKGAITKFGIKLDLGSVNSKELFTFAKGSFQRVEGSKPEPLLQALKVALEAKKYPKGIRSVSSLPFTCAVLGMNQSQERMGGFSSNPPGNWIVTKVFLADGEAEVFLNLNPKEGIAEFSIKDEEYGNTVLKSLATVL